MRLVLLALLLPVAATAQTVLTPGHPDLAAAAPQAYEYVVRVASDGGRVNGWRTLTETVDGDRLILVTRLARTRDSDRPADTTVVAWPGLAPLARSSYGEEQVTRVAVSGGRMRGRAVLGNLDEPIDVPIPADVFVEGVETRLARSLPLRAGYVATARIADGRGQVDTDTLRVVGETTFERPDGSATPAWTITVARSGQPTSTYTVDAATRELLRFAYEFRPGMTMETVAPPLPPTVGVLRPGDPSLDTSWMGTNDTATFAMNLIEPMAMPVGTSTITRTVAGGVVTSVQTLSVPSQGMNETQTATADLATLRPLTMVNAGQQAVAFTFSDGRVTGTKSGAPVDAALDAPVFDASWGGEIAQSLPLAAGYTATAAVYDASGVSSVTFTVTGQENVDGAPAWVVQAVSPNGPITYTIDAATRRLLKMRVSPQAGVVVEMIRQP